jgi:ribosomal protein S14
MESSDATMAFQARSSRKKSRRSRNSSLNQCERFTAAARRLALARADFRELKMRADTHRGVNHAADWFAGGGRCARFIE